MNKLQLPPSLVPLSPSHIFCLIPTLDRQIYTVSHISQKINNMQRSEADECRIRSLQDDRRSLQVTIDTLKLKETYNAALMSSMWRKVASTQAEVDILTTSIAAQDDTRLTFLQEQLSLKSRQLQEVRREACSYQTTIDSLKCQLEVFAARLDVIQKEEFCYECGVDPDDIEISLDLLNDMYRSKAYLLPRVEVRHRLEGNVVWVLATWEHSSDSSDSSSSSITTLRIEFNPISYTTSPTPPKFKMTTRAGGGEEEGFPVGHRIAHLMNEYMGRCWGRGGFNSPLPPAPLPSPSLSADRRGFANEHEDSSIVSSSPVLVNQSSPSNDFMFDVDPRCVAPYAAQEGGLIAHLVRYAMLRMETYADFCVVCDRPIVDSRDVICNRELCDHSFHSVGVGYASVGLERTVNTAPHLKPQSSTLQKNRLKHRGGGHLGVDDDMGSESITSLMFTHIISRLSQPWYQALVCSSGSLGYHSFKEMLENGTPGSALLFESVDLREVVDSLSSSPPPSKWKRTVDLTWSASTGSNSSSKSGGARRNSRHYSEIRCFDSSSRLSLQIKLNVPTMVSHVTVFSNLIHLPSLMIGDNVTSLDLNHLPLATSTEQFFIFAQGLTALDMRPLTGITEAKGNLLCACTKLASLQLAPFKDVHYSFLIECSSLTTLDLSPLSQVKVINDMFLCRCSGLTVLDLAPLSQVTTIGGSFLSGCTALTALDLSSLSRVVEVKESFLYGCSGLSVIDLSPLSQLTAINGAFLSQCSGLTTIDLAPLSQVTTVGLSFLRDCTHLKTIDLAPLSQVVEIKEGFLCGCTGLVEVDLSPLLELRVLDGTDFLGRFMGQDVLTQKVRGVPPRCALPWGWTVRRNNWTRDYRAIFPIFVVIHALVFYYFDLQELWHFALAGAHMMVVVLFSFHMP